MYNDKVVTVKEISDPRATKVVSIIANGGVVQSAVNGVKGSAEKTFRSGYVEISPKDLGLGNAVEITEESGILDVKQWEILRDNLSAYIIYNNEAYGLSRKEESMWIYEHPRYSSDGSKLLGTKLICLNTSYITYEMKFTDIAGGMDVRLEGDVLVFGQPED